MKERRAGPTIVAVLAIPLILLGSYAATYYTLLAGTIQPDDYHLFPRYRWDASIVHILLKPACKIDQWLRPQYWQFEGDEIPLPPRPVADPAA